MRDTGTPSDRFTPPVPDRREIRTPRANARGFYQAYLNTPGWRKRRLLALQLAGYRCTKCHAKRDLNVHHRSYERLGDERDSDLQVLCRSCHEEHHYVNSRIQHLGVFIKLVSEALREEHHASFADLSAAVKDRCAAMKIPYDGDKVARAVDLVHGNRRDRGGAVDEPQRSRLTHRVIIEDSPLGRDEASAIVKTLGLQVPFRSIPKAERVSQRTRDCAKALEMVAQEMKASIERCEALEHKK